MIFINTIPFHKRIIALIVQLLLSIVKLSCVDAWRMSPYPIQGHGVPFLRSRKLTLLRDASHSGVSSVTSLLGRDDATRQAFDIYSKEFSLSSIQMRERCNHHVVYVSGATGIGKSTFSKNLPSLMRSVAPCNDNEEAFQRAMNHCIELYIGCNAQGDGINDIDKKLSTDQRLWIRLLARAARFEKGLKSMLVDYTRDGNWNKQIEMLQRQNSTHVSELLQSVRLTKGDIYIPAPETTFEALVKDLRSQLHLSGSTTVPIFVVIDDHQLMYESFLAECKGYTNMALLTHKDFLYRLMTIQVNNWCLDNNVRIMPMFAGINSACLKELIGPALFYGHHIPLRGLNGQECKILAERYNASLPRRIHKSWFRAMKSCELSPIDYIAAETMGNPILFEEFLNNNFPQLHETATTESIRSIIRHLRETTIAPEVEDPNVEAPHAYEAVCTGIPLVNMELTKTQQPLLNAVSILVEPTESSRSERIVQMPPLIMSKVKSIPENTWQILQDNYCSDTFELAIGERLGMAINLRRSLCSDYTSHMYLSIEDLFGMNSKLIWSQSYHGTRYFCQISCKDVQCSTTVRIATVDAFWCDNNSNIVVKSYNNATTLNRLLDGEYDTKGPVLHIGEKSNHPWFDLIVWLKNPKHLWWIQAKGSDDGTTEALSKPTVGDLLDKVKFEKLVNGIQQLVNESNSSVSHITHSIALIVTRKFSSQTRKKFQNMVSEILIEHHNKEGACKIDNVVLVDDMPDFVPPIAHKFKFKKSPAEHVSLTKNR